MVPPEKTLFQGQAELKYVADFADFNAQMRLATRPGRPALVNPARHAHIS